MQRGYRLPAHVNDPNFRFGVKSTCDIAAKELVAPPGQAESRETRELYKRSHASLEPGEQRRRGYKLPPGVDLDVREADLIVR